MDSVREIWGIFFIWESYILPLTKAWKGCYVQTCYRTSLANVVLWRQTVIQHVLVINRLLELELTCPSPQSQKYCQAYWQDSPLRCQPFIVRDTSVRPYDWFASEKNNTLEWRFTFWRNNVWKFPRAKGFHKFSHQNHTYTRFPWSVTVKLHRCLLEKPKVVLHSLFYTNYSLVSFFRKQVKSRSACLM